MLYAHEYEQWQTQGGIRGGDPQFLPKFIHEIHTKMH